MDQSFDENAAQRNTLGDRMADALAKFGGSWSFLFAFGFAIVLWIVINATGSPQDHFDPYPFILLNLVLSCLASVQAPVIMMSQNRMEALDRARSVADYAVNMKAELEITEIQLKLDILLDQLEELQVLHRKPSTDQ